MRHLFLVLILLAGSPAPALAAGNEAVAAEIVKLFESRSVETGSKSVDRAIDEVRAYYATRAYKPVWVRDNGPKSKAKALLAELRSSIVHGLSPQFYNVDEIGALMDATDHGDLARLDMLLSGAVVEFGRHLRNGSIGPDAPGAENAVSAVELDTAAYIEGAADAGNFRDYASDFINADARYVRLIAKLSEFQRIAMAQMWPQIATAPGPIARGASDSRLAAIRRILVLTGDLSPDQMSGRDVLVGPLVEAVRTFQQRHGLDVTGAIDAATLAEMAVPAEQRSTEIRINLERRRWQNRPLSDNHLYINLAEPVARLVRSGEGSTFLEIDNLAELRKVPTFFGTVESSSAKAGKTILDVRPDPARTTGMPGTPVRFVLDGEIELEPRMQVFVTYITAWVSSDGQLHFSRDIFRRDDTLARLLRLD